MRSSRLVARLLIALVALVQGLAPGVASIVDARPAARAAEERAVAHIDAPGSPHAFAHPDHCVLCGAATHLPAVPAPSASREIESDAAIRPASAVRFVQNGATARSRTRPRAPPA